MQGEKKLYRLMCWILGLVVAILYFQVEYISVFADNEKVIANTAGVSDIYLYIKGVTEVTGGTVQIGNKVCENVSIERMDTFSTPLRTVILIDNSKSIKFDKRADIQNILTQLVDQSIQGEEYRVGLFSDTITWLSDYSSDYESIKSIIDTIQYVNQETYFSDCLYSIIEEMRNTTDVTFSRIIMVSDGADDNSIGYTNYEVSVLAEKSNIPLYMIGTPGDNKALETMFSFARTSKADYYLLDGSISNEDIVAGLLSDHELVCMRVMPDADMLDGSQKNIQVTLNTQSGEIRLTTTVNMPFATESIGGDEVGNDEEQEGVFGDENGNDEEQDELYEPDEVPSDSTPQPSVSSLDGAGVDATDDEKDGNQEKGLLPFLIMGSVVALAVVVCIIIIIIVAKKKKAKATSDRSSIQTAAPPILDYNAFTEEGDKTRLISEVDTDDSEATRMLSWQPEQSIWLVLKSVERPDKEFRVLMKDTIQIGRKNADIVIDFDPHISSRQCEVIKRGDLLYIRDLGSLNGTYYENTQVFGQEVQIVDGGIIKVGDSKFIVTIIRQ